MMNYIRSELYRIFHSSGIYCFAAVLAGLSLLFNIVIALFAAADGPDFRYNTTSYAYSNLVASPMFFLVMGALMGFFLYEGNRKNGNLKNTIAFGIPRTSVFAGECIVATISAIFTMIVVLAVFIVSAMFLLENTGPVKLTDLLMEIPAIFLLAVAALIASIVFMEAFEKNATGIILWVAIWLIIPKILFYLGFRIDILYDIAMWMPNNFFGSNMLIANTKECITTWGTAAGMARCVIAGFVGTVVFFLLGVVLLRKRDI